MSSTRFLIAVAYNAISALTATKALGVMASRQYTSFPTVSKGVPRFPFCGLHSKAEGSPDFDGARKCTEPAYRAGRAKNARGKKRPSRRLE